MRLTTFLSVFIIAGVYGQTDFPGCFNYELTRSDTWLSELIEIQRQDMGLSHLPTSAEMMELAKLHLQDLNMWYDVETDYCKEYLVWYNNYIYQVTPHHCVHGRHVVTTPATRSVFVQKVVKFCNAVTMGHILYMPALCDIINLYTHVMRCGIC